MAAAGFAWRRVTHYHRAEVIMSRLPYTKLAPGGYSALASLGHYISTETALEPVLLELVYLRASQRMGAGSASGCIPRSCTNIMSRIAGSMPWRTGGGRMRLRRGSGRRWRGRRR